MKNLIKLISTGMLFSVMGYGSTPVWADNVIATIPTGATPRAAINIGPIYGVATASSTYHSPEPSYVTEQQQAIDGSYSSHWNAGWWAYPSNPAWLVVDLQRPFTVSTIVLQDHRGGPGSPYNGYSNDYNLYTSSDGTTWTAIASGTLYESADPAKHTNTITLPASSSTFRYVKFEVVGGSHWAHLIEMEIFASPDSQQTITNANANVAVNPVTNKIYVTDQDSANVAVIDGATNTATTITVGDPIGAIAVNPVTNKIYVANRSSSDIYNNSVIVIDGDTNSTASVEVGDYPIAIKVNPSTNKIYVANRASLNITVIDGVTNSTTTIATGAIPFAIAVNPVTNMIYIANYGNTVTVMDGNTNSTSTVTVGTFPFAIEVNPITNKIYVANYISNDVTVIDGSSNSTTTIAVGSSPVAVAVNSATNKVYVANQDSQNITVIDGSSNSTSTSTSTIIAGDNPTAIAVNSVTNKVYVANAGTDNITVIDSVGNTSTVAVQSLPWAVAVNPVTNRIYAANWNSNTVSVIAGDTTPPVISSSRTPSANAYGWNNTNVTVTFTATDDASIPTCTVNSAILSAEGAEQSVSTTCTDAAGNSASATVSNINIDKAAPMLSMPSLVSNYTVGSSVALSFSASDTLSGLASVLATLNGNPVSSGSSVVLSHLGTNTFTLTATDRAGNTAMQTHIFTVTYGFGGFLPPLTASSRTNFHLGSVIPVKFDLYDANGTTVSTAVAHLSLQRLDGGEPVGAPIDATPTSGADTDNLFRYNGGHYAYNLSTKPFTAGIWRIQATLDDGTVRTIDIGLTSK